VGAAGSPYAGFKRALSARNVTLALAEARDLPKLNLADSLTLLVLIAEKRADLSSARPCAICSRRRGVTLGEAQLVLAALAANVERSRALLASML